MPTFEQRVQTLLNGVRDTGHDVCPFCALARVVAAVDDYGDNPEWMSALELALMRKRAGLRLQR